MSKVQKPAAGGNILHWAKDATREINSLQPTAGNGMKINKTDAGTTYSVDEKSIPFPDSTPKVAAGALSSEGHFATTYSLEKTPQNAFSLFQFSLSDTYTYSKEELSNLHFVMRDITAHAILSAPTVRYVNVYDLIFGNDDGGGGEPPSEGWPGLSSYLSVCPDSELLNDNLVSKSIYHNSKGGLAIYHFEEMSASDVIDQLDENEDYVLVRHKSGNGIPVLKYTNKLSGGGGQISGVTSSFNIVTRSEYSTTSHKFINWSRMFYFTDGLLKSVGNETSASVFEAVAEQV